MPTVVYIGNFEPDHSTENDVRRAFGSLGWTVVPVQESTAALNWADVRAAATTAALVLYTATRGLPTVDLVGLWSECARAGIPTACLHLDRFYSLASPKGAERIPRSEWPARHPMFRVAHAFTADGEHQAEFARDGVNHHWLKPCVAADRCYLAEPFSRLDVPWDVAFVGSYRYHPEWPGRPRLIDHLRQRYGRRFVLAGEQGEYPGHGGLRGDDLNRFYATVPVIVGDSCFARRDARYWSDRFYETWGRGGFMVFPFIQELALEFRDNHGSSGYPSWAIEDGYGPLDAVIDASLDDAAHRNAQRERMQRAIRAAHTYEHRVTEMLQVLGL